MSIGNKENLSQPSASRYQIKGFWIQTIMHLLKLYGADYSDGRSNEQFQSRARAKRMQCSYSLVQENKNAQN